MTLDDVKSYLRIDFDEDDKMIGQMMEAAEDYIIDTVGEYDSQNAKANLLYLALVQDLYDNRTLMSVVTEQQRKRMSYTYASIILQLQYQAKGEARGESIREG